MLLSDRAKDAIKVALAMMIAYAIALYMDWDRPYWAALAVAFISLETSGQSFHKGLQRLGGTLLAAFMALTLLSLFPQQRWMFMIALSSYVFFCTYMMKSKHNPYFWNVAAFVTIIVAIDAAASDQPAFYTAVLRIQETALGVLTYSMVSVVLWPRTSSKILKKTSENLTKSGLALFQSTIDREFASNPHKYLQQQGEFSALQAKFAELSNIAELESYEVWEVSKQWKDTGKLWTQYERALEVWRQSFNEVNDLELETRIPWLTRYEAEITRRFKTIIDLTEGKDVKPKPLFRDFHIKEIDISGLQYFQKAALSLYIHQLDEIERITYQLHELTTVIFSENTSNQLDFHVKESTQPDVINMGQLKGALRAFLCLWVAYLSYIYFPNLPAGTVLIILAGVYSVTLSSNPYLKPVSILVPGILSSAFGAFIYLLIMPHLHSFWSLGTVIFLSVFSIAYLFHTPQLILGRMFGLANFVMMTNISNHQSYSFNFVADQLLVFLLVIAIYAAISIFTFNLRPEVQYLNLLRRFFASTNFLLTEHQKEPHLEPTKLRQYIRRHHLNEVESIPHKMTGWIAGTSPRLDKHQLRRTVIILEALSIRLSVLINELKIAQSSQLYAALRKDIHDWSAQLKTDFAELVKDPTGATIGEAVRQCALSMPEMETTIAKVLEERGKDGIDLDERLNIYRILGGIRSVCRALEDYEDQSLKMDWPQLQEARF
ncbi:hypothetical protein PSE_3737 [Pseudovibrio sp. FO-BEG1]|uniref:FUSC family protein n=1 Tax=Pseudovibrio sp. (strain FO-BEG1) TaxID=911045 RepID=UPI000238BFA8|nr:FUSC family protein [Pseudovibrio sp. FO-BEG1]AEV38241.1 hypothetical protein PSE_3737 [Pseudovibrio sp. FO-BEG1]